MCPRCRSGAVGSKPTLTTSGGPSLREPFQLRLELRGADDVHAALGEIRELFVDRHRWHAVPCNSLAALEFESTAKVGPMRVPGQLYRGRANILPTMPNARRPPGLRRRDILKGCAAAGIGALTGGAALRLHVRAPPRRDHACDARSLGLVRWPRRTADRLPHRPSSQRDRVRTASSPTRSQLLMAERPDLIVLGGDYVTWGDREFVQPAAEALAGPCRSLGRVRHPRQP